MQIREYSATEYTNALAKIQGGEPVHFLQAPFYGAWQAASGKTVVYFGSDDGAVAGLAVKYDAPGGISFFYAPYGPVVNTWTPELFSSLRDFFKPIAAHSGVSFVRFDNYPDSIPAISNRVAVAASLQPRNEWLLDISKPQDDIWTGLHKHARYSVRLAERAQATFEVFEPSAAPLDTFFELMQTTAGRDKFGLFSRDYYEKVLANIDGFVALVRIDGKPAAVGLFALYDGVAHYVFAGSSDEFRKISPPYFLIWNAILEAKKRGITTLNFGGIAGGAKGDHLAGVTLFKTRWGGYAAAHRNPTDLVYKPFKYFLFKLYKTLR